MIETTPTFYATAIAIGTAIGAVEILLVWAATKLRTVRHETIWTEEATDWDKVRAIWNRFTYRTDRYEPLQMVGRGMAFGFASTAIGLLIVFGLQSLW